MLTPIEIQGRTFKSGMGYTKRQVDLFLEEVHENYEILYKENMELKDKVSVLSEGIQYYKTIEKTLQKALILAEKTAEETQKTAMNKAASIEKEAHAKAAMILADARHDLQRLHNQTVNLAQQYEKYKAQFKQLAATQIELLNSAGYQVAFNDLPEVNRVKDEFDREISAASPHNDEPAGKEEDKEASGAVKAARPDGAGKTAIDGETEEDAIVKQQKIELEAEAALTDIFKRLNIKLDDKTESQEEEDAFEFLNND